jgi:hypothetical protein
MKQVDFQGKRIPGRRNAGSFSAITDAVRRRKKREGAGRTKFFARPGPAVLHSERRGRATLGVARRELPAWGKRDFLRGAGPARCYCGGLTPSLVICTRVAVILPPAYTVTAMNARTAPAHRSVLLFYMWTDGAPTMNRVLTGWSGE